MDAEWRLPRKYEKPFRDALNHAGHKRVDELRAMLVEMTDQQVGAAIQLCGLVAAYTVIDVVGRKWPTDKGLRMMAEKTAESAGANAWHGVTTQNLYLFMSKCALGFEDLAEVLGSVFEDSNDLLMAPFFFTIQLLGTFGPTEQSVAEFLDIIEDAYEKAWLLDLNLLPALMVRARMPQPEGASDGNPGSR
ncbi:MAG: hypothetical protein J2P25_10860 [Nocardiopsaceae bacterium]|nr:hypothetical protein [Nocardiopsaceae bacterium]